MLLESRTRATLRRAEFGFLGVMILTCRHTPFFCGHPCIAGCLGRLRCGTRGCFTSWLIVGMVGGTSLRISTIPSPQRGGRCVRLVGPGNGVKGVRGKVADPRPLVDRAHAS